MFEGGILYTCPVLTVLGMSLWPLLGAEWPCVLDPSETVRLYLCS